MQAIDVLVGQAPDDLQASSSPWCPPGPPSHRPCLQIGVAAHMVLPAPWPGARSPSVLSFQPQEAVAAGDGHPVGDDVAGVLEQLVLVSPCERAATCSPQVIVGVGGRSSSYPRRRTCGACGSVLEGAVTKGTAGPQSCVRGTRELGAWSSGRLWAPAPTQCFMQV